MNLGSSYFDGPMPQINGFNVFYTNYAAMAGIWNSWPVNGLSSIPQMAAQLPRHLLHRQRDPDRRDHRRHEQHVPGRRDRPRDDRAQRPALVAPLVRRRPRRHRDRRDVLARTRSGSSRNRTRARTTTAPAASGSSSARRRASTPAGSTSPSPTGRSTSSRTSINSWADRPGYLGSGGRHGPDRLRRHLHLADGPGHATGRLPEARDPRRRRSHQLRPVLIRNPKVVHLKLQFNAARLGCASWHKRRVFPTFPGGWFPCPAWSGPRTTGAGLLLPERSAAGTP